MSDPAEACMGTVLRIVDDAWQELQRSPYVQQRLGVVPTRLPDVSFTEAERRSAVGSALLRRLDELNPRSLPHDLELTLRLVRFRARTWSREADWYWMVVDPRGIGFHAMFLPTAYCGGVLLNLIHDQLALAPFDEPGDADRYLGLIADYARVVDQFAARTAGQAERGIRMPRAQVFQARALLSALKAGVRSTLRVDPKRIAPFSPARFARELERRIVADVEPAFDRVLEGLSDAYLAKVPDSVGIGQYPGGPELYAELVKLHTTLDLTPEQVHARGLDRMAQIEESMRELRSQLGFQCDGAAFLEHLNADPAWRARTVADVNTMLERYIDRMRPRIGELFVTLPRATYGVAPLPDALQESMTFGYYEAPTDERPHGTYLFNPRNLTQQGLFHLAGIVYHELIPGHHLHLALQQENDTLHPFRMHNYVNAFNEGWAEYAAGLAGEIGLYEQPEERYGRLLFDAFLTSRLVVDTGMNVLGWSLERGQQYLRAHSALTEREILSETMRYACDRPAQALAYKLGDTCILDLRERMRAKLGGHFSLKKFHTAVLAPGALPLSDLEWHIERENE